MGIIGVSGGGIWLCPVTGTVCNFKVGFMGAWSLVTSIGWQWHWCVREIAQVVATKIGGWSFIRTFGGAVRSKVCHGGFL